MVRCRSTVDMISDGKWHVEVWGDEPHDFRRTYTIDAESDQKAAFEGIRRFVEEMEAREQESN
jgi:hypothetical protein